MSAKIDISPEQLGIVQGILKVHLPKGTLAWAFGSRVTWTAKPFSDLDIALEGPTPLSSDMLVDLEEAFEASDLPWKVDVIDLNAVSPEFRAIVERRRVPADWEEHVFEDCIDRLIDYRGKSPQKSDSGIPVLSAKVVKTEGLVRPIEQKIALDYYPKWMTRGIPTIGDVIFTTEGPLGEVIQLDEETSKYALGQRIVCLRGKKGKLDNTFLRYLLTSPQQRAVIEGRATGTTVLGISQKALRQMPVILPSISEQEEIGSTLSAIDNKIELNRRMNETLEAMARALFQDWFVDFGPTRRKAADVTDPAAILGGLLPDPQKANALAALFPGNFGDNGLPEGWEERPFVGFLDIIGGGTPKTKVPEYWGGEVPWFSVVDTPPKGGVFVWNTEKTITERGVTESSVRMIEAGTTIISARGTVGNIAMAARPMTFNQSCYALRAVNPVGDIFIYLATERMVERLKAMAHGSVFSTITRATFESLNFAWAGKDVFAVFEGLVEPMFELIKANGQESQTLVATRDLLLPKLMSGEIRLVGAEDAA
ncbi:restriction endonuclease subunit S [Yangia mangrovi]|uniref:Restriction endonuclease subunit S n=1 Tax=Alloyangia mangrovi TaxID=1779329 RepID=A0A2A3K087_9RHOB|nr:restriction endonuclease subunit S [Alloyangia mangrovi]MCT4372562.1 restriction endonuclease subunit S [Alloyangia mangrovi]